MLDLGKAITSRMLSASVSSDTKLTGESSNHKPQILQCRPQKKSDIIPHAKTISVPVQTDGNTTVRRCAIFERLEQVRELRDLVRRQLETDGQHMTLSGKGSEGLKTRVKHAKVDLMIKIS